MRLLTSAVVLVAIPMVGKGAEISLQFITSTRIQMVLKWEVSPGGTPAGYQLQRSLSETFTRPTTISLPPDSTVYSDTGLAPENPTRFATTALAFDTNYYYRVRIKYAGLTYSDYSNTVVAALSDPVRGESGDLWADVVLGKPDFSQNTWGKTMPTGIQKGGGVFIDTTTTPNRMYLVDSNHSRILGFSDLNVTPGRVPDVLIGQPSFYLGAPNLDGTAQRYPDLPNPTAETLALMTLDHISVSETVNVIQLAVDSEHALYVSDVYNNRILKYEDPFATDSVADEVWGQPDFVSRMANNGGLSARSIHLDWDCGAVAIGPDGSLWVCDATNHRVLRFPKDPGTVVIDKTANLVLGQPNFTSNILASNPPELNRLSFPAGIAIAADGTVYVSDGQGAPDNCSRLLVYDPPFRNGMNATRILARSPNVLRCKQLSLDPVGGWIWAQSFIGDHKKTVRLSTVDGSVLDSVAKNEECRGLGIDGNGDLYIHRLYVGIYKYPRPDYSLGPLLYEEPLNLTGGDFRTVKGMTTFGDQLIVIDGCGGRALIWNDHHKITTYQHADDVWGQPDFVTDDEIQHMQMGFPTVDPKGRLWIYGNFLKGGIAKVPALKAFTYPLTHSSVPVKELWDTYELMDRSGSVTVAWTEAPGFAVGDDGDQIWLPDRIDNRVLRINNIDGEHDADRGPYVDVILGQHDARTTAINQGRGITSPGRDTMFQPAFLALDGEGNLWVSDSSGEGGTNQRILFFDRDLLPDRSPAVLYALEASGVLGTMGRFDVQGGLDELIAPMHPAFSPAGSMVVGLDSYGGRRFPLVYLNPHDHWRPQCALGDFTSMQRHSYFDGDGNLYVGDNNWARVLIYMKPLLYLESPNTDGTPFLRGDSNADDSTDLGDAVAILFYAFMGEPIPCKKAADVDNNGKIEGVTDAIFLLRYIFLDEQAPDEPLRGCGIDQIPDELTCDSFPACP
jgi:hypothetical protein